MEVPPGLRFLALSTVKLAVSLGTTYFLLDKVCDQLSVSTPSFPVFLLVSSLLVAPAAAVKRAWENFWIRRKAAARGAVLPPRVSDVWPFDFGVLAAIVKSFNTGVVGKWDSGLY
jgi:hypothetical protein